MPTEQTDTTQTPPEEITYTPTVWADDEDGGTPINAANLNNIEEAIVALVERTTKQVVTSMIKDGAVTNLKLSPELQDLLSRMNTSNDVVQFDLTDNTKIRLAVYNQENSSPHLSVNIMVNGLWLGMKRLMTW